MPKRRLTDLAHEFEMDFEKMHELVVNKLEECMVTGHGKNTWISEAGQMVLDDLIPINVLYRGRVMSIAPNNRYVYVFIKELGRKVPVKIPLRYIKSMLGKTVNVLVDNKGEEPVYYYERPKFG